MILQSSLASIKRQVIVTETVRYSLIEVKEEHCWKHSIFNYTRMKVLADYFFITTFFVWVLNRTVRRVKYDKQFHNQYGG